LNDEFESEDERMDDLESNSVGDSADHSEYTISDEERDNGDDDWTTRSRATSAGASSASRPSAFNRLPGFNKSLMSNIVRSKAEKASGGGKSSRSGKASENIFEGGSGGGSNDSLTAYTSTKASVDDDESFALENAGPSRKAMGSLKDMLGGYADQARMAPVNPYSVDDEETDFSNWAVYGAETRRTRSRSGLQQLPLSQDPSAWLFDES
jgi:hypothetical protein